MSDVRGDIESGLRTLVERTRDAFTGAHTEHELRAAKAVVLGKKGELTAALKRLGEIPGPERRATGERVNGVKNEVERLFEARLREMHRAARETELRLPPYDLTLPGRVPVPRGHLHPLTRLRLDMLDIFPPLGFLTAWGPQV